MKKHILLSLVLLLILTSILPNIVLAQSNEEVDEFSLTEEEQKVAEQIEKELNFILSQQDSETGQFIIDRDSLAEVYGYGEDLEKVILLIEGFNEVKAAEENENYDGVQAQGKFTSAVKDCLVKSVAAILGVPASYKMGGKTLSWYIETYDIKGLAKILAKNTDLISIGKKALLPVTLTATWATCGATKVS